MQTFDVDSVMAAPGVAYDIYCRNKDQRYDLEDWLAEGIRRA
jgi:hypothetical protein